MQRSIDTLATQKHTVDLSSHSQGDVGLPDDFELTMIFDDILLVEYIDENEEGEIERNGIFIPTNAVTKAMPLLPVEEAGRLTDPVLRENFIARVFAYHRWQLLLKEGLSAESILNFHASYKYSLMAHAPKAIPP